jgi:hypothetical protein
MSSPNGPDPRRCGDIRLPALAGSVMIAEFAGRLVMAGNSLLFVDSSFVRLDAVPPVG